MQSLQGIWLGVHNAPVPVGSTDTIWSLMGLWFIFLCFLDRLRHLPGVTSKWTTCTQTHAITENVPLRSMWPPWGITGGNLCEEKCIQGEETIDRAPALVSQMDSDSSHWKTTKYLFLSRLPPLVQKNCIKLPPFLNAEPLGSSPGCTAIATWLVWQVS